MTPCVRKVCGVYTAPAAIPSPPVLAWITEACRRGAFEQTLRRFAENQPELGLDITRTVVTAVDSAGIYGHIPCVYRDHESTRPFVGTIDFLLKPKSSIVRL